MLKIIKPNYEYIDERGSLIQLVREGYSQFNVITSRAGVNRGHHFHKINQEAFYIISGKLRVDLYSSGNNYSFALAKGDFFTIDPFDFHSFYFIEDTVLVSMYNHGVEMADNTKDIFTE